MAVVIIPDNGHAIGLRGRGRPQADSDGVSAAAHGYSIHAIMTYREDMADEIIPGLENMRGTPSVCEFDADLKPFPDYFFVAAQGKSIRAIWRTWRIWPGLSSLTWRSRVARHWSTRSMPTSGRFRRSFRRGSWIFHPCHHDVPGGYGRGDHQPSRVLGEHGR